MSARTPTHPALRSLIYQVAGLLALVAAWQVVGKAGWAGKTLPALTDVLRVYAVAARRALLLRAAIATTSSAALGLCGGALLGFATALIAHLLPSLEPGLDRLAVVVNATPAIALGPVLIITAGRQMTPALLASVPVFFLIYVAGSSGLRASDRRLLQFFSAMGASRWRRFILLDGMTALPSLLSGLKIAVPTAMMGAIVGEWFGAPTGLGVVILNTMQNFQIPLMWATVLVVATISSAVYATLSLVELALARRLA